MHHAIRCRRAHIVLIVKKLNQCTLSILVSIGKQRALSREVTCNFRLYLKIGRTSVKPR